MPFGEIARTLRKYPKTCGGVGVITTCGILIYERNRLTKLLDRLTEPSFRETDKKIKRPEYIYIHYHVYKEFMRKLREKQEADKKWINVIIHPIGKWWKSIKHSVAWRLLNIAQNGNQQERLKAVRQLVHIDHLKDWDFRHLAQICDARTAVSLARSGSDLRWFLPVHMKGFVKHPQIILNDLYDMLNDLNWSGCVKHFFIKYFPKPSPVENLGQYMTPEQAAAQLSSNDTDLLKEIISFLHHLTKDPQIAQQIVNGGGLAHLMELRKFFANDNETLSTLCKVLANMSMADDCLEHFHVTGWIGTLAEWQQCPDLRLQVIAAKTMANLDYDDPNYAPYPPNVYPLYPRLRTRFKPKADIIFIHGLLGGVFYTWRQKDRKPTELTLYGKNAFYTSETDDIFLVGEQRRLKLQNDLNMNKNRISTNGTATPASTSPPPVSGPQVLNDPVLKATPKTEKKPIEISNQAVKEFVEELRNEAELDAEWEVVHPDVPLKSSDGADGPFSVAGNKWQNQDDAEDYTNCWPMEWLPDDFPEARIIGIDYTSAVTEWSANFTKYCPCEKGQGHIKVRGETLLERLSMSDIGNQRPVIWIGHSMGGILTKLMLLKALKSRDLKKRQLAESTRSIVFLGTPHRGSPIAKWKQHMQFILSPSIEVKEMEENSPKLLELHKNFMSSLHSQLRQVKVVSIAEGAPTMLTTFKFPLRIVTEESARIDYGDFYILKDDHLSLSKPIFRQSFLYQRLLKVIDDSIQKDEKGLKKEELHEKASSYTAVITRSFGQAFQDIFNIIPGISFKI